jgi:class 3 adenylate cyclase
MLREKNAHAFRILFADDVFDLARDVNHFLALNRINCDNLHKPRKK